MKTTYLIILTFALLTGGAAAQAYGNFYPKGQSVSTTGNTKGFSNNLWDNAVGESWYNPAWNWAYATIKSGLGDSQAMVSVTNFNFVAATVPANQLTNFMNGRAYSSYATHDIFFNKRNRGYGANIHFLNITNGTLVGYGIRTSKWSNFRHTEASSGYMTFLYSNWGYQPGNNPKVNGGAYSAIAWSRSGWLGSFSLNQPPLHMGSGRTRRWNIGEFSTAIDTKGVNPFRTLFTSAQNLSASTTSDIFVILKTELTKFLSGSSFSYYAKLFNNTGSGHDLSGIPAGRTYCIVVRDGVNTTSSEGAQVAIYGQTYR